MNRGQGREGVANRSRPVADILHAHIQIAKLPLCLMIGCSTLFGGLFALPSELKPISVTVFGIIVLATGGASLNSVQEVRVDKAMRRTAGRPLPQKTITTIPAAFQALLLILLGLGILRTVNDWQVLLYSSAAIIVYNFLYTPLKQYTVLAIIPGAVCGALPVLIGWRAAGGEVLSYKALLMLLLLGVFQVAHFTLIILKNRSDYRCSSQPTLLKYFSEYKVRNIALAWICSCAFLMMVFTVLPTGASAGVRSLVIVNALVLAITCMVRLLGDRPPAYRFLFVLLNLSLFNHMLIMSLPVLGLLLV